MTSGTRDLLISIALILGNAFFVAAEYALVSVRRSKMEALSRRGNRTAQAVLKALDTLSSYVAGVQIAITMFGIGVGAVTEPYTTDLIEKVLGSELPPGFRFVSILIVTFILVVVGEVVPKYLTLKKAEQIMLFTIHPLRIFVLILRPLVVLVQVAGGLILKPFGVDMKSPDNEVIPKEELLLLVQSGSTEGVLDKMHAEMVTKALKLDSLDAEDIMVHRLDIKWLEIESSKEELKEKLKKIPYSRMPVCRGDIDEMEGIVYLHDIFRTWDDPNFSLESILRPTVAVPENLTLERIVAQMRDAKSQMLIVMDEYGGTSGLITLEDVVEEVFGELEDHLESERPSIEIYPGGRVSARANVRMDELLNRLHIELEMEEITDTLATIIVDDLGRVPKPGDTTVTPLGKLRVENMARRRITRVSVLIAGEYKEAVEQVRQEELSGNGS